MRTAASLGCAIFMVCLLSAAVAAQRGGPPQAPPTPRASAPVDLTGYWLSLVTEDWRHRMTVAPKGDYLGVPLNAAGRQAADAWDPARDEAAGELCKAFGAAGVMRQPGRLHITWQDDQMLKIETDVGTQTRMLTFGRPTGGSGEWQGVSAANWDRGATPMGGGFGPTPMLRGGALKVVTTGMKAGYLRKNGVPYSADAVMTEYFDRFDVPGGDSLLVVSTEIVDPTYLAQPFWTSTHFKRQNDATGWNPTPCSAR
jgi:hypothetical protein